MTLTKKDREEIKEMISMALAEPQDVAVEIPSPDYDKWDKYAVKSDMLGLKIAPENYWELDKDGAKNELFTWNEAMEIEKKLPDGWRLPTRSEWVILAKEFGVGDDGKSNAEEFAKALGLPYTGYRCGVSINDPSDHAFYWSRAANSSVRAYSLNFNAYGHLYPQYNSYKFYGFAVRCVKEVR